MSVIISDPIGTPIHLKVHENIVRIMHPENDNAKEIALMLATEDLDVRRLLATSQDTYASTGKQWVQEAWQNALNDFREKHPEYTQVFQQILIQANGIQGFKQIPQKGIQITDPFNMHNVELNESIEHLAHAQMQNTVVAKKDEEIVGIGRLLEVEGSIEIVSLMTKKEWRGNGIATKIIDELLSRCSARPIYSFQVPELIPFYLKRYQKHGMVSIEPFDQLPQPLQRDLFYMNIFWGPFTIISIK